MRFTVRPATLAIVATAGVALTGCGLSSSSSDSDEVTAVTIYSPRPSNITDHIVAEFEAAHPDYEVQLLTLGAQEVADRIRAESANTQADVWWGGTAEQFEMGAADGHLTPFPDEVLDRVPDEYHGTDDAWFAEQRQLQLIAYNHDVLDDDELPGSWSDLIAPEYAGTILIRDVAPSGTMRGVFSSLIYQHYAQDGTPEAGYDFLRALDANTKDYAANPEDLYLRLQRQEAALTIWNHQDILAQTAAGAPFSILVPAEGVAVNLDGVAKVDGSPNEAGADAFAEFLISDETQSWLAAEAFQIPTVEIESTPEWLESIDIVELPVDRAVLTEFGNEWIDYWLENIKNQG